MGEVAPQAIEVRCPGCEGRYRLTARGPELPAYAVPCPRCKTAIPVETVDENRGWTKISHDRVFKRSKRLDQEALLTRATPEPPVQSRFRPVSPVEVGARQGEGEPAPVRGLGLFTHGEVAQRVVDKSVAEREVAPASPGPSAAVPRGHRQVRKPEDGSRPADPTPDEPSLLEQLRARRDRIVREDIPATPAPPVVSALTELDDAFADLVDESIEALAPDEVDELNLAIQDEPQAVVGPPPLMPPPPPATPAIDVPAIDEAGIEREPADSMIALSDLLQSSEGSAVAEDASMYRLRVGKVVYDAISFGGLVELFRAGVWVVADEIAEGDGDWIALDEHPVFEKVRHAIAASLVDVLSRVGQATPKFVSDNEEQTSTPEEPSTVVLGDALPVDAPPVEAPAVEAPPVKAEVLEQVHPARRTRPWVMHVIFTVLGAAMAVAGVLVWQESRPGGAAVVSTEPAAMAVARHAVERAISLPVPAPVPWQIDFAVARAVEAVEEARAVGPVPYAKALMEMGEYGRARRVLVDAYDVVEREHEQAELQALFDESIRRDPRLEYKVVTLHEDILVDHIRALGGGRNITLRMQQNGENAYAFKAAQALWEDWWRAEVAADTLCEIIVCHFEIPLNQAARVSREDFNELYGRFSSEYQTRYAERFESLIWTTEAGSDGVEREYLYGTLKDWIPRYVHWPIEYEDVWRPWLSIEQDPSVLDTPYTEAIAGLRPYKNGQYYRNLVREQGEASTRDIARQVSGLMIFDFLTNNFDRFSGVEEYYGVNNHFADGTFISIDNAAAFQFNSLARVTARFSTISRFSRSTVNSVRMLRPEVIDSVLFPEPSEGELRRLATFWSRRDEALRQIDALIAEHGEDAVLALD